MTEVPATMRTRILVVDDSPETADVIRSWYASQPYEILSAPDAEAGLGMAKSERPDLILLDIKMPGMDGLEAAHRLKSDAETRGIPVILLTAMRDVQAKVKAFNSDADDYVMKPFDNEELDARIRAMLRKRDLYAELENKSREDEKTGLANYRHFREKLEDEWLRSERYGAPLSLLMLDLDDFKGVNDSLGHLRGDRVLREFAILVTGAVRATDLPARYGGEEFAVLLPHTSGPMAARLAERIRTAVKTFVFLEDEKPTRLTVSAGVATRPSAVAVDSPDALVKSADAALYRAKALGKDRVVADGRPAGGRRRRAPRAKPTQVTRP